MNVTAPAIVSANGELARSADDARHPFATSTAVMLSSLCFAWAVHWAHNTFLVREWAYYGFTYFAPGVLEWLLATILVAVASLAMPVRLDRPSALILLLLHVTVVVPAVVISLSLHRDGLEQYAPILIAMTAAHSFAGLVTRRAIRGSSIRGRLPSPQLVITIVILWAIATVTIFIAYGSVLRFASLDEIYRQRFSIERSISALSYVRSYHLSVFSPALVALGLVRRNYALAVVGVLGCVLSYMIDAQKAALMIPVLMIALYFAIAHGGSVLTSFAFPVGILAALSVLIVLVQGTEIGFYLQSYIFTRGIAIPALTLTQYYDLFSSYGFTWWSNVTGISLIVPPPPAFGNHPSWPSLGQIVGDYYYGARAYLNANANPYSGEGAAAGGVFGILVIGAVLTAFLRVLDRVSEGWDRSFALLATLPMAVALSNGHLSTTIVSFGGGLWLAFFAFYKPRAPD